MTKIGRAGVLHRFRNEQRWKDEVQDDVLTGETKFSNRVRYLLGFTIPVSENASVPSLRECAGSTE